MADEQVRRERLSLRFARTFILSAGVAWFATLGASGAVRAAPLREPPPASNAKADEGVMEPIAVLQLRELDDFSRDVAWSADSKSIASLGFSGRVEVWRVLSGELVHELQEPSTLALAVQFERDGNLIVCGGESDGVWNLDAAARVGAFREGQGTRPGAAIAPDGQFVAVGDFPGPVYIWKRDEPNGPASTLKGHSASVYDLDYSRDGSQLVTAGFDRTVRMWDLAQNKQLWESTKHDDPVRAVAMSSNGQFVASSDQKMLHIWNALDGTMVNSWPRKAHTVSLALSPVHRVLVTAEVGGALIVYTVPNGQEIAKIQGIPASSVAVSPDGTMLALATLEGTIEIRRMPVESPLCIPWGDAG